MLEYYQNIPSYLNPDVFTIGFFSVKWYSLSYLAGFCVVYFLLRHRIRYDIATDKFPISNFQFPINFQFSISNFQILVFDFLLLAMLLAIVGGRLGYVLFYNFSYFWHNPWTIISPYDFASGKFTGIYGMSYHGGLLGIALASWIFTKKNKLNFWQWADFVVPAIPAGYFFGRIGNFLNLELYGKITNSWLGMHFTASGTSLRYPSQLIEASLEGIILFAILWRIRNKKVFAGFKLVIYLIGYGIARIIAEFFREPDAQIGLIWGNLSLGQILSAVMIITGAAIYFHKNKLSSIIE